MSALWPTLADLSHLQQWTSWVLYAAFGLFLIFAGCYWLSEWLGDRETAKFKADLEHLHERRKFQAITGGRR